MVIFRIIFNLFRLFTRGFFNIFWLPISIISHSPMIALVLILVAVGYLFISSDDQKAKQSRHANPTTVVRTPNGQKRQVATPVRRVENGDSAFANDLYLQMTDPERAFYSQNFYTAMRDVADGQVHSWTHTDMAGSIRPDTTFKNKSGVTCRTFGESLKVHAVQQQITGIACQKNATQWCKLQSNATPACDLGHNPGFFDSVNQSFRKLF